MEEEQDQGANEAYRKRLMEFQKAREAESQAKAVLKQILSPEAYDRMMNIRLSSPELFQQLTQLLIYLAQNGQLKEKLSEAKLKELISRIVSRRKETSIKLMRK